MIGRARVDVIDQTDGDGHRVYSVTVSCLATGRENQVLAATTSVKIDDATMTWDGHGAVTHAVRNAGEAIVIEMRKEGIHPRADAPPSWFYTAEGQNGNGQLIVSVVVPVADLPTFQTLIKPDGVVIH